ncbi:YafY family protein [Clostridium sp. MB40-C1]|uniref:helix-turn-helix transcriptional regulator n=1 Tax=Clostridium sp. MB40-C1 TaxID=3070996 RepID=UPI0027E1F64F|nr:YafY family protein [Clostridium sp. MB40-C1]WMJ81723.1 YafY family protein [Clostridium sp. MB40-C1]
MQINRLFEIIYILLDKKTITAKELAEHFEVSIRTIYRDIEVLSGAGIPIYTSKGKGGGISIIENFVLNKSMLSEEEQNDILMSLQGLNAIKYPDTEPVLNKLSLLFNKQGVNWIDVDFSYWGSKDNEREKFNILKRAILNRHLITFDYFSSYKEKTKRTVEPLKLVFKGQSWYLYGYCRVKDDFRIFKITRIKNLNKLDITFMRDVPKNIWTKSETCKNKLVTLVLRIDKKMSYRIYDEFDEDCIKKNKDGNFNVTVTLPENEWVYGYIMSYGNYVEILEPDYIREIVKVKLKEALKKYL